MELLVPFSESVGAPIHVLTFGYDSMPPVFCWFDRGPTTEHPPSAETRKGDVG